MHTKRGHQRALLPSPLMPEQDNSTSGARQLMGTQHGTQQALHKETWPLYSNCKTLEAWCFQHRKCPKSLHFRTEIPPTCSSLQFSFLILSGYSFLRFFFFHILAFFFPNGSSSFIPFSNLHEPSLKLLPLLPALLADKLKAELKVLFATLLQTPSSLLLLCNTLNSDPPWDFIHTLPSVYLHPLQ